MGLGSGVGGFVFGEEASDDGFGYGVGLSTEFSGSRDRLVVFVEGAGVLIVIGLIVSRIELSDDAAESEVGGEDSFMEGCNLRLKIDYL
jgi:hypothetical protein